jgi:hypothetical protein
MNSEEQRAHWDLKCEDGLTAPDRTRSVLYLSSWQFVARSFPTAGATFHE